jgi:hypothetical protein
MNKFVLTSFAAVAVAATASAQTAAISITGGSQSNLPGDYRLGWAFNTTGSLSVSKLGWNNVGTWSSTQVGIFNRSTGALLTSATIQSSSTDILNGFKYATLATPFTLAAGEYTIAGVGRSYIHQAGTVTPNIAGLSFVGGRYSSGSTLVNPTTPSNSGLAYFGPNFQASAVPEPGTFVAIGLGVAAFARRRLRNSSTQVRYSGGWHSWCHPPLFYVEPSVDRSGDSYPRVLVPADTPLPRGNGESYLAQRSISAIARRR